MTEDQAKLIKLGQSNDYVIRCQNRRVQLWINGKQTVDEPDKTIPQIGL